ncbi:MAG: HAD family hydrolase [bacterium]|nr:HAD family hydrolase [bacterium]
MIQTTSLLDLRWMAFDLDRTLIGPDRLLPDRTRDALRKAIDSGYKVIIATGRPPRSTRSVIAQIGREIALVSYNGGYAEAPDGERLRDIRMDAATATRVLDAMRAGNPGAILMEAGDHYHYDEWTEFAERHTSHASHKPDSVGKLDYVVRSGVNKFLAIGTPDSINRTETKLLEYASDQEVIRPTLYKTDNIDYVEVMPVGVTKKTGIDAILGRFGWSWNTGIAFGDAPNDYAMMDEARYSVAVEDSCPEIQALADFSCPSAIEQGVAVWLEEFLLKMETERAKQREIAK